MQEIYFLSLNVQIDLYYLKNEYAVSILHRIHL